MRKFITLTPQKRLISGDDIVSYLAGLYQMPERMKPCVAKIIPAFGN